MAVVTSISLIVNGPTVHVTVADQNGNPLPPANITWPSLTPGGTVSAQADDTGFNFSASGNLTSSQSVDVVAVYKGPGNPNAVDGPNLIVNVTVPVVTPTVTALQYMSP